MLRLALGYFHSFLACEVLVLVVAQGHSSIAYLPTAPHLATFLLIFGLNSSRYVTKKKPKRKQNQIVRILVPRSILPLACMLVISARVIVYWTKRISGPVYTGP